MSPEDEVLWWYEKAAHARADVVAAILAEWLLEHEDCISLRKEVKHLQKHIKSTLACVERQTKTIERLRQKVAKDHEAMEEAMEAYDFAETCDLLRAQLEEKDG